MAKRKRRFSRRRELDRINERIRAPKVRVIDGINNRQLGVMNTQDAIKIAKINGLDLVEIASNVNPPVCKIVDYGKYKYDKKKQKKEAGRPKGGKMKEVKFRVGIDPHDYGIKMRRAEKFLGDNNKLRVQLMFRGRQMAHKEIGFDLMKQVAEDLSTMAQVDFPAKLSGRNIGMQLSPLPEAQRVPKFLVGEHAETDEGEDDEDFADIEAEADSDSGEEE